jgi:hypothetical protein
MRFVALLIVCLCVSVKAQDPVGVLEGQVQDPANANISGAGVTIRNLQTGYSLSRNTARDGSFRFSNLPVGEYALKVESPGFAALSANSVRVDIGRIVRLSLRMEIATQRSEVNVLPASQTTDLGTALGKVVSSREALDLPLNGRDLTQLGRLQPGVAPITAGLAQAGGIARSGQAFAVNGQRPESNNYLLDGVNNVDSVNGGYALRTPVDAVTEFRILTANAPAEYGETSGSTVSVVTKSGSNQFHGDVYDFLRNDAFDARNFFAQSTEPLHRNQFGATLGGPIRKNRDFFFVYYEGQRLSQGQSQAAIVPSAAQRRGDFSGLTNPATGEPEPLINYFTGMPFPGNQIPAFLQNPIALNAEKLIPLPNIGPQLFATTQIMTNNYDQGGARFDHYFGNGDSLFARYATSQLDELDPLPVSGAGCRAFPLRIA